MQGEPLALYQLVIDVHLQESSNYDKLLSSLIRAFRSIIKIRTLADSELISSTT